MLLSALRLGCVAGRTRREGTIGLGRESSERGGVLGKWFGRGEWDRKADRWMWEGKKSEYCSRDGGL